MLPYVAVWFLLIAPSTGGWVKVANFYSHPRYDQVLTPLGKTEDDLLILAVDTEAEQTRIPIKSAPYYGLSEEWTYINDTMYFGRVSVFTRNYANEDVEHNVLKFQGNMTVQAEDHSVMSVVRNDQEFSGYLCNMGERVHGKKTFVNICLHNVTDYGNIDPSGIKILVKEAGCSDCTKYKIRPHIRGSSLEFGIPNSESKSQKWNITIEYSRHTVLCHFIKDLSPENLNFVIMKQNLTVSSMFECVFFSQQIDTKVMEMWTPLVLGLSAVVILGVAAAVFYKKCNRACLRQLMPTPDQDTAAAPYRSFNSSNHCDSPKPGPADNSYIKMKTINSCGSDTNSGPDYERYNYKQGSSYPGQNGSGISRHSEPHYERI